MLVTGTRKGAEHSHTLRHRRRLDQQTVLRRRAVRRAVSHAAGWGTAREHAQMSGQTRAAILLPACLPSLHRNTPHRPSPSIPPANQSASTEGGSLPSAEAPMLVSSVGTAACSLHPPSYSPLHCHCGGQVPIPQLGRQSGRRAARASTVFSAYTHTRVHGRSLAALRCAATPFPPAIVSSDGVGVRDKQLPSVSSVASASGTRVA